MGTTYVQACPHCSNVLYLLPYRDEKGWEQAVVCQRCDTVRLFPRELRKHNAADPEPPLAA